MATRHGSATVSLPNDTDILIARRLVSPRALVWEALTTPRQLLRWWGPHRSPLVACEVELRVGGSLRCVVRDATGNELAWHGTYRQIVAPEQIVSTGAFEGFPDTESTNTVTLTEADGATDLEMLVHHSCREHRDDRLRSGLEGAMQAALDRLDDLLDAADEPAERFRRVAGRFTDRAAEVPADRWDAPPPCEGWVARDVVRHLVEWVPALIGRSGVTLPPAPPIDDDPFGAWTALADGLQAALDDPHAAAIEFDVGPPGRMTVARAIAMLVVGDVVVHTWDLARATGLDETLDPVVASEMLAGMQPIDDLLRRSGHYGPKVEVAADADLAVRLIAFTGRDPGWRPPVG